MTDLVSDTTETHSRAASLALGDSAPGSEPGVNWPGLAIFIGLFATLWILGGKVAFFFIISVVVMIFLHELGHFVTARMSGMKVTDFFICFGPTIFAFKRNGVTYGLKAIPAGAFVRIIGMSNLDPVPPEDESQTYRSKSYARKMLVITAGSMMHFALALVTFVALFGFIGIGPTHGKFDSSGWVVEEVLEVVDGPPSAAQELGLQPGDTIVSIDGDSTLQWYTDGLIEAVRSRPGESAAFVIERDGEQFTQTAVIGRVESANGDSFGRIGVAPDLSAVPERQTPGVGAGFSEFGTQMKGSITAIPRLFYPTTYINLIQSTLRLDSGSEQDADRPVSIYGATKVASAISGFDPTFPILLFGLLNCFIGVFNLVPLLPLDGGHAAIATYERIRSRNGKKYTADIAKLLPLTYGVLFMLAILFVTTIILDTQL